VTTSGSLDCGICARRASNRPEDAPVGGYVYEDACWYAQHAPVRQAVPGQLMLVAKRHFLDAAEMQPDEAQSLGSVLGRLTRALKDTTGAERVYVVTVVERTPHWHTWVIPRPAGSETRGTPYLTSVLTGGFSTTEEDVARVVGDLKQSLENA
jgi:diadenosine tetraphosphate (Ap4A) HIT family hydrolase